MLARALRFLGALAILAVGAVHLQQYIGADYRAIPTVGTLFLLNAIAAAIIGVGLLVPVQRFLSGPRADAAVGTLALAAVAIAVGSLLALLISESGGFFGFAESGYRAPIVVAIIAEAATVALLGPIATVSLARAVARRREARTRRSSERGSRLRYSAPGRT
jgi:multisubunit Na+/H+ antiporter MnhF subunit